MDQIKNIKEQLISVVQSQMGDLSRVDTRELGETIDMIKDLAEATYYCTITEAMEDGSQKNNKAQNYYPEMMPYYTEGNMGGRRMYGGNQGPVYYSDWTSANTTDPREGRSPRMRRMYMESKDMHADPTKKMHDLEMYMQELTSDITDMIYDATPEEKTLLKQKISTLANKIV